MSENSGSPKAEPADVSREASAQTHRQKQRIFIVVLGALAVFAACAVMWHYVSLRPFAAAIAAGGAVFLAPLPALITPETRGKWYIAVGLAALAGLGTWYATDTIERERDELSSVSLTERAVLVAATKELPASERRDFVDQIGWQLKSLDRQRKFVAMRELAEELADIIPDSGHAYYYQGEAFRALGNRTDVLGAFQNYLAAADHHGTEAIQGDYLQCYHGHDGYCGERTAWINHLLANDSYRLAERGSVDAMYGALDYEHHTIDIRSIGFPPDITIASSCQILTGLRVMLESKRRSTVVLDSVWREYKGRGC
jgi:hypothetical protein